MVSFAIGYLPWIIYLLLKWFLPLFSAIYQGDHRSIYLTGPITPHMHYSFNLKNPQHPKFVSLTNTITSYPFVSKPFCLEFLLVYSLTCNPACFVVIFYFLGNQSWLVSCYYFVLVDFIMNFTAGFLKRHLRSSSSSEEAPPCTEANNVCVQEVTTNTFQHVVVDSEEVSCYEI